MGTMIPFFKKNLKIILMSFKNFKKYLDVANYLTHKHAKYHIQTLCILGAQK
jgi:hypothetical protein